jgi:hypothetical protein
MVQITAILDPNRSWSEKWLSVRKQLERVETACSANGYKGIDDVSRAFAAFFIECNHMYDWLWQDKSTGLNKSDVSKYMFADQDLRDLQRSVNRCQTPHPGRSRRHDSPPGQRQSQADRRRGHARMVRRLKQRN